MEEQTTTTAPAVPTDNYDLLVRNGNVLFMYAPIGKGETYDYVTREYKPVGVTDADFISALNAIKAEGETDVHIRINSNGGSTKHGQAIIAAMQNCDLNIHTYNDGTAASMAAAIWACGQKRHMAKNAILMIHHPWDYCTGHAQAMRECAERLDKISEAMMLGFSDAFGKPVEEIKSLYFGDYTDKYYTYTDVQEQGFLAPPEEEYQSGLAAKDKDAIAALVRDPFAEYRKNVPLVADAVLDTNRLQTARAEGLATTGNGLLDKIVALFRGHQSDPAAADPITQTNTPPEMNKAELLAALKDGKITPDEVQAALTEAAPPPPPPAAESDAILQLRDTVAQLTARLEALASAPGASRTTPGAPPSDPPVNPDAAETPQQRLERTNAALLAAADKSEALVVTMGD